MQKLLFLADLHGNMPATLAMETMIETVAPDEVWFLGDAVGKGPENDRTCDWVREHCDCFVGGNWDYGIGNREFAPDRFYWDQLGEERMRWLRELPREMELQISGLCFRIFHGRPVTELLSSGDSEQKLTTAFSTNIKNYDGILFADSHRPFVRSLHKGYVANTGSVGNSLGVPRAHALLMEGEKNSSASTPLLFTVLSVPYDNQKAADIARKTPDLPRRNAYVREVLTGIYSR